MKLSVLFMVGYPCFFIHTYIIKINEKYSTLPLKQNQRESVKISMKKHVGDNTLQVPIQ